MLNCILHDERDWGGSNLVVRNTSIISLNVRLWDPFFNKWFYTKPVKEVKVYTVCPRAHSKPKMFLTTKWMTSKGIPSAVLTPLLLTPTWKDLSNHPRRCCFVVLKLYTASYPNWSRPSKCWGIIWPFPLSVIHSWTNLWMYFGWGNSCTACLLLIVQVDNTQDNALHIAIP